jgi:hypothetical protein
MACSPALASMRNGPAVPPAKPSDAAFVQPEGDGRRSRVQRLREKCLVDHHAADGVKPPLSSSVSKLGSASIWNTNDRYLLY